MSSLSRRTGRSRALLLACLIPVVSVTVAADQTPEFELQRFEHATKPPAGGVVVINPWGDVRVRQGASDDARFNAVMQLIGDSPFHGTFDHRIEDDRLVFELSYPADQRPATAADGRIDAGLILPPGVPLEIHTDRGRVLSKTLDSPLTVRATDAAVEAGTRSEVDIETRNGPVRLQIRPGPRSAGLGRIASSRGDIEVQFARDVPIAVSARTGASLTTNDPDLLAGRVHRDGRSQLGAADRHPEIRLDSDSGRLIIVNRSFIPGARPLDIDD